MLPIHINDILTPPQQHDAYQRGIARSHAARHRKQTHRFGWQPTPHQQRHTDGMSALAECLVATIHSLEWTSRHATAPDKDGTDVGGFVSVRWTPLPHGRLIIHEDEPADLVGALVVGERPDVMFVGCINHIDGMKPQWWREDVRHPAYFVPQHALR